MGESMGSLEQYMDITEDITSHILVWSFFFIAKQFYIFKIQVLLMQLIFYCLPISIFYFLSIIINFFAFFRRLH